MKSIRILLLSLLIGSYSLVAQTINEKAILKPIPERISIRLKPLSYFLGGHIGIEKPLSARLSWVNDLVVHSYIGKTFAINSSLQYYLTKEPTKRNRWHLRCEAIGGYFWDKSVINGHRYYAGLGVFAGFSTRISSLIRLYAEGGIRGAIPFGNSSKRNSNKDNSGTFYYVFVSPASLLDINVGLSFDL